MRYEEALFVPPSGAYLVLVECVFDLCVMLSITLMGSVYLTLAVLP